MMGIFLYTAGIMQFIGKTRIYQIKDEDIHKAIVIGDNFGIMHGK
jgi:hypothetical protein